MEKYALAFPQEEPAESRSCENCILNDESSMICGSGYRANQKKRWEQNMPCPKWDGGAYRVRGRLSGWE